MVFIRVDTTQAADDIICIEIISGGASEGVIGFTFGSEKRRIKDFEKDLQQFCSKNNIVLEID